MDRRRRSDIVGRIARPHARYRLVRPVPDRRLRAEHSVQATLYGFGHQRPPGSAPCERGELARVLSGAAAAADWGPPRYVLEDTVRDLVDRVRAWNTPAASAVPSDEAPESGPTAVSPLTAPAGTRMWSRSRGIAPAVPAQEVPRLSVLLPLVAGSARR
jgi:hypothetical protein